MKKKIFFGFTLFAMLFTLVAWQFAAAELVELQKKSLQVEQEQFRST